MDDLLVTFCAAGAAAVVGLTLALRGARRSAADVLEDLTDVEAPGAESNVQATILLGHGRVKLSDPLGKAGLFSADERRKYLLIGRLYPWVGVVVGVSIKTLLLQGGLPQTGITAIVGLSIGFLIQQGRLRRRQQGYIRSIEFYLPVVMERLVMAVQSGLDILAAIGTIVELEEEAGRTWKQDPVTRLLSIIGDLTDRGLSFTAALHEVSNATECSAIRHSFVHLAVAYQEGGELVMPLKELSDSTQLYYQESLDEQIAKLPVKATMPLLCTFAGLILCFITSPVIQLMHLAGSTIKGLQ